MRRTCLSLASLLGLFVAVLAARAGLGAEANAPSENKLRPNVLWITSEDNGPELGCYGDEYATTPNIDSLAAKGVVYLHCWSNAPVCAPARTAIISGMYPTSLGGQHMRSNVSLPAGFKMYPQYLRAAGYYCTNNSKEDYNLKKPGQVWDESSRKAHWKNRRPGQPFFAIFNITVSHESQIRRGGHKLVHDPAKAPVPAYHPDVPTVRQGWAQYYDKLSEMDAQVGHRLKELADAGLADDTIVFYYGDHGSGMPRSKRWPFNSGLHVPLVVYIPPKFQHLASQDYQAGGKTDRLVSFVDLAPTLLSLCGVKPPGHMQGRAFLGPHGAEPRDYLYGFRGRMDERYDMVRSVRDKRYVYLRHYMPHRIYGQHVNYMFITPTTRVWRELFDAGKLNEAQSRFWQRKPPEELFDLKNDPDEVNNLAGSKKHAEILQRLRKAHWEHALAIRDTGFLPEPQIHSRSKGATPYEMAQDESKYPLRDIMQAADLASRLDPAATPKLIELLGHKDCAVRYWAALGLLMRGEKAVAAGRDGLAKLLEDEASTAIAAAEALARYGDGKLAVEALDVLLAHADVTRGNAYIAMMALNALDHLDERAAKVKDQIAKLPQNDKQATGRIRGKVGHLIRKTLADLK